MIFWRVLNICLLFRIIFALEETPHTRKYFYVGGSYVLDPTKNHIFTNQMYVEELTPLGGSKKPFPLVFVHGLGQTGTVCLQIIPLSKAVGVHLN